MTEQRAEYDADPEGDLVQFNAPDFGVIPAEMMCDKKLSRSARLLGCLLWTYRNKDTGEAWPKQKVLAARLDVTVKSVRNWMVELRERQWMKSERRIKVDPNYRGNPGALIHTLYWSRKQRGPEAPFLSEGNVRSGTTGSPTSQEHTKEQTKLTKSGGSSLDSKNSQISKAEKALLEAKVYPRTITRITRDYSEEVILEKAMHWREGKLVRAIEEDWKPRNTAKVLAGACETCGAHSWATCTCEEVAKAREDMYGDQKKSEPAICSNGHTYDYYCNKYCVSVDANSFEESASQG